ncbi:M23 family metallopeptidase [Paraclostridium bifermentans]|uniref:M23 family metallopeptidase n=1 Tax=Paraclostridium bifermentans TaxID=1490 RepID=UPI00374EFCB7
MFGDSKVGLFVVAGVATCIITTATLSLTVFADEKDTPIIQPILKNEEKLKPLIEGDEIPDTLINDKDVLGIYKKEVQTQEILEKSHGWQCPVEAKLTSTFGPRIHPISGKYEKAHGALDLAIEQGTPIHAAKSGKVISAGWLGGYGNQVVIDHGNGEYSRYGHMCKILVKEGEHVDQTQKIGLVGSTGNSTGPHLHFEIMEGGTAHEYRVDPEKYIDIENNKSVYWSVLPIPDSE